MVKFVEMFKEPKTFTVTVAAVLLWVLIFDVRSAQSNIKEMISQHMAIDKAGTEGIAALMNTLISISARALNVSVQQCIDQAAGTTRDEKIRRCVAISNGQEPR